MPTPQPPAPAERFATILLSLCHAVAARTNAGLSLSLIALIISRIRGIKQRFARLAARIREGRYAPRRTCPRSPIRRQARRASPLPQDFGWLLKLVPDAVGYRSQLEFLLRDDDMAALLAAAPAAMARPLRSLCWMLRIEPPKILARPRPALPAAAAAAETPPPWPPPASPPSCRAAPEPAPPACACGPPLPA